MIVDHVSVGYAAELEDDRDDARDFAWRIWCRQPMPKCSETEQMAAVFEKWRADGWTPNGER